MYPRSIARDDEKLLPWTNNHAASRTPAKSSRQSYWTQARETSRHHIKPTSYLDGLRGFAALLVFSQHHVGWAHPGLWFIEDAYGSNGHRCFAMLPGIRLLFTGGHAAVAIFFVISGYVLALTGLKLIQKRDTAKLPDHLGSALFRRWIRLFLPVALTTLAFATSWHVFGIQSASGIHLVPEKYYKDELWRWYADFKNYSYIFHGMCWNAYNDHAWSIPYEMRGSVVVWTVLLAVSNCRTGMRLALEAVLAFYFIYIVDGWYCAAFMVGMLLCDIDLLAAKDQLPTLIRRLRPLDKKAVHYVLLVLGLFLSGCPSLSDKVEEFRQQPGWYFLSYLKPQAVFDLRWFYRLWGAAFLLIAIPKIPWSRRFFETNFCQYLGKISYSLYLIHGPLLWTVGDRLYAATGRPRAAANINTEWVNRFTLPDWGIPFWELNYLIPFFLLMVISFWVAELTTWLVDDVSVKCARKIYEYSIAAPADDDVVKI